MNIGWQKKGAYGFVELNNQPVNAINLDIRKGLIEAVKWAEKEKLERVILSGVGRAFAAGADTKEFDRPPESPHLPEVINIIERSNVPWIAALHGAVLGGGAELALGCRYRIARADASIGFPEVTLGLIPGAGGTQRLPCLIGCSEALRMIPTGKPVSGSQALKIGLVDKVSDNPIIAASRVNLQTLRSFVPVSKRIALVSETAHFEAAQKIVTKRMRGQKAPLAAITLIKTAQTSTLKQGLKKERAKFMELRGSPESRALRHVFFAERAAKIPDNLKPMLKTPNRVTIIGGGTMGASIAFAFLNAGLSVVIVEADRKGVFRACEAVEKFIASSLSTGHIDLK